MDTSPSKLGRSDELQRVRELMNGQFDLTSHDFAAEPRATWGLVLDLVQYRWLSVEKSQQLASMREEDLMDGAFTSPMKALGLEDFQSDALDENGNTGCLKPSEHEGDYQVNRDLITQLLAVKHNAALKNFLLWQRMKE